MKRVLRFIYLMIFIWIVLSFFSIVNAASATITPNKKTATVGDSVKITLSINAGAWNLHVSGSVNDSVVSYNADGKNEKITKTYNIKTTKVGTLNVSLKGDVTDGITDINSKINQTISITVKEKVPTTSSKSNKNTTTNTQTSKKNSSTEKTVTTKKAEEPKKTEETKKEEEPQQEETYLLQSLTIEGAELLPEFNSEVYDYTVKVADKEQLNISAKANQDNLIVDIVGNENLQYGENTVTIHVKGQDDKEVTTYQLKIIKEKSELTLANERIQELEKLNTTLKTVIIALAILVIFLWIVSAMKIRKYKNERNEK